MSYTINYNGKVYTLPSLSKEGNNFTGISFDVVGNKARL